MCYSPKIKETLIPYIYKEAKEKGKPMTKVVNKILEDWMLNVKCRNCLTSIKLDEPSEVGYCPFCECEVFLVRG